VIQNRFTRSEKDSLVSKHSKPREQADVFFSNSQTTFDRENELNESPCVYIIITICIIV